MPYTKEDVSPFRAVNAERVPLTDEERQSIADAWNAAEAAMPRITALDAIVTIEQRELLPRAVRESTLGNILAWHLLAFYDVKPNTATTQQKLQGIADLTNQEHPGYNPGFVKLKALDDEIRALRSKL